MIVVNRSDRAESIDYGDNDSCSPYPATAQAAEQRDDSRMPSVARRLIHALEEIERRYLMGRPQF